MELQNERQRRPRRRAQKTTGVVAKTINEARGIAEPLDRYGELLACQIVALYNAIHGLPTTSEHSRARLGRLFHESEGLPQSPQSKAESRPMIFLLQAPFRQRKRVSRKGFAKPAGETCFTARGRSTISRFRSAAKRTGRHWRPAALTPPAFADKCVPYALPR